MVLEHTAVSSPFLHETGPSNRFPFPVRRESVDDAVEPSSWVSFRIQLDESEKERVMYDFACIFPGKAVPPAGATNEPNEKRAIEPLEFGGRIALDARIGYSSADRHHF